MEEQIEPSSKDSNDSRRLKAPNKKKLDEDLVAISSKIRDLEAQSTLVKSDNGIGSLRSIRCEKDATFDRNKKINSDLKTMNQEISSMIYVVSQKQSGLVYKYEDKHNDAIRKLEWNLAHHSYRLIEERKIVAEIDKLKRSKINLCAYNNAKSQLDELRSKQRRMREERDHYSKTITSLRAQEEEAKRLKSSNRNKTEVLKKEIDEQYNTKRKLIDDYKRRQLEFQDALKKRRQESFKKKDEERKAIIEAKQREAEELELLRLPYDSERQLCFTLMSYLQGFSYSQPIETPQSTNDKTQNISATSNQNQGSFSSGPAEELEDGNLILLRKSDDNDFIGCIARKTSKKTRKYRKPSMTKLITHCPQVISQFASLNLQAPSSAMEIPASLEQLRARKLFYEQMSETQSNISLTESGICEMSRQASNTESCGSACETRAPEHIFDELINNKYCCPDFPSETDSSFHRNDSESTESSDTLHCLSSCSSGGFIADVDEIDSNGQSFDNSGHLSHIDQKDISMDHNSSIQHVNELLNSQSETLPDVNKPLLNQSVASSLVKESKTDNCTYGNGMLDNISECEENESSYLKMKNMCVLGESSVNKVVECKPVEMQLENNGKHVNTSAIQTGFKELHNGNVENETTHL